MRLKLPLAPVVALAATLVVSALGIHGLTTGARALRSALLSTGSAHDLESIAAGVQEINGTLYHVLTLRGAQIKGVDAASQLRPLLAECDRVARQLREWRDTRATPAQRARVSALILSIERYRGAIDFVSQMLDLDFIAAVSFVQPFDRNFKDLTQSVDALVREVQAREAADADGALRSAATTTRAFELVGSAAVLMALLAAGNMVRDSVRARRLARQNRQLTQLAQVDALTGLGNRRCFDDMLASAWAECTAKQASLALILFDIDHFKKFNDSQGHQAGDDCLRRVGQVIIASTREQPDRAARYGGEEFAIVMPDTGLEAARVVAERVRQAVLDTAIAHPAAGPPGVVTVSLGIASMVPAVNVASSVLIESADQGLYLAKRSGRNRVADSRKAEPVEPGPERSRVAMAEPSSAAQA